MKLRRYVDVGVITVLGVLIHVLPFWLYGRDPLGYDGGFYRRYIIEHTNFLHSVPGLGSEALVPKITFDVLSFLHLSTNMILYGSFIALSALAGIMLFLTFSRYADRRVALFALIFWVLSPVQYFGYWCMLYKNIFGIVLLLLTALLIEKRSPWMYVGAGLIACTHQTTSVVFLMSLVVFAVINKQFRREAVFMFCVTASILVAFRAQSIGANLVTLPQASFLSWYQYLTLSAPILGLALIGLVPFLKAMRFNFLSAFCLVAIVYPISHLPFYQRIFLFTDLALILMAAYGATLLSGEYLAQRLSPDKHLGTIFLVSFLIGMSLMLAYKVSTLRAMVTLEQLSALEQIDVVLPKGSYVLTTSQLTPWVEGFSHTHVIAPTLLYDHHTKAEWTDYWNATRLTERTSFLDSFPKPLYAFLPPEDHDVFMPPECTQKLTTYISLYTCQ
ncbi:MAG: hypothetical protein WCG55_03885 [bacterium]